MLRRLERSRSVLMKKVLFTLLHAAGVTHLAAWLNRRRVVFLCYHGVTERDENDGRAAHDPHGIHVPASLFEQQLDYLSRRHRVVALRDYLAARREGRKLPDYSVILTFDDGFRNFYTAAAPRLVARKLPASLFIITDHTAEAEETSRAVETDATDAGDNSEQSGANDGQSANASLDATRWSPADDCTHLSWSEVRALLREHGFEIGSHTCSHTRLPALSPAEIERELRDSLVSVAAHVGADRPPALSYPKGEYSFVLSRFARAIGYDCAVTADGGANDPLRTDPFALGRTLIGDEDDVASFAVRVSGLRDWLVKLSALVAERDRPTPRRLPHVEPSRKLEPRTGLRGFASRDTLR
jgi:peptidoglycan/xylan/chitin deacetylase (PgdA/CDA1 family)